ncbi:MAG: hypothetical protein NTV86_22485, partial [Planctomycetota bacterium]|nr:hypothetical protein [Planctomycetota bacterium]
MRIASCLLALTASAAPLLGEPPAATRPAAGETLDYCALLLDGNKVGYATHARRVAAGQVATTETMHLGLRRGPVEVTVDTTTTVTETLDGEPLRLTYVQKMGPLATKVEGQIANGQFTYTSSSGLGGPEKQTIPWPEGALLNEGLLLLTRAKGLAQGTRYTARVFSPETLQALDAQLVVGAKEKVDLLGRVVLLTRTDMTLASPIGAITAVSYVNDQGETL